MDIGKIGDNVFYTLYSNGTLLVRGTGSSYDYDITGNVSPFNGNEDIKKNIVSGGVTYIGEGMFYKAKKLEEVRLPDTVTAVGWCSFSSCSSLATSTWLGDCH